MGNRCLACNVGEDINVTGMRGVVMPYLCGGKKRLRTMTWNVAGLTPNVFEFWGQAPNTILEAAEEFLTRPEDTPLSAVLTNQRLADLQRHFAALKWPPIPDGAAIRLRKTGLVAFLSDESIGKKRLVSLPDRTTAGQKWSGGEGRPGATTPYSGNLSSLEAWWDAWMKFMFSEEGAGLVEGPPDESKDARLAREKAMKVHPHPRKYWGALSDDEIALSQPLQVLHLALFDGALIHVLNESSTGWTETKARLLTSNREKLRAAICASYSDCGVIFLQEASTELRDELQACLPQFRVVGGARGQDSLLLLNEDRVSDVEDVTSVVVQTLHQVEPGDAVCVSCRVDGEQMLLGSFHADSEGVSTLPFLEAFTAHAGPSTLFCGGSSTAHATPCVLGLDANCEAAPLGIGGRRPNEDKLTIANFRKASNEAGLQTCFGEEEVWTTFKARTFIQPQFQKAVLRKDLHIKADRSPKDHILASTGLAFAVVQRDTSGKHSFLDVPLPSEAFPSDHAIITAELVF